ncbi:hypothetical protein C2R22_09800 [Salinigranum rubrum]|uniref:histidine kinase n=1 Tax=Salinigranum rubrum TaxID=755307 RepID=A0A2I8VJ01_9EURY|nr:PAS domain-containing sensor histidine kinase [Salinigranum rubrum]AUV81906.1 hypothetical protein C2R22_09800 [Salinigranum rubrum]
MNVRGEVDTRVLWVGVDADVGESPGEFDVRRVATAAEACALLDDTLADSWYPDCVVGGVLSGRGDDGDADGDDTGDDGLGFLRRVDEHTHGVATVFAPGTEGSERLAARAVAAGITGYCPADESLEEAVRTALERVDSDRGQGHDVDRRYRMLAENLPNGAVALYDRELRYLVVGGTVFDDLPLDRDHLEGERFEDAHSPAFVERYGALYRAALDGEHSDFEFTYAGRTFRGHTVPVRDRAGAVVAGMALTQDVTTEHAQRARLERQNRRLDRFASIVSHDLRTPVNVVEGSLVLLREAAHEGDEATVDQNAERISRACRQMTDIIDNVLTLARQPDAVDDPADVAFVETVRSVWTLIDSRGTDLVVDAGEDVTVRADESALRRLLENLLSNAVTHGKTDRGDEATVRVEWFDGDVPGFAVSDDGPGLAPEERDRAFDWGYTTDEGGVGFGLGIVQGVAEAHGWTVSAGESRSGGARFEVRGVDHVAPADGAAAERER